jgi:hypothetical protein
LRQWLDDLDSATFAVRDGASKELVRVADRIEEALRQARADAPSAEKQRRLEALLNHLDPMRSPEQVRHARAVTALEWAATPPARQLLEALAQGAPTAGLTRDAKASLERLSRRAGADRPPR